MTCRHGAGDRSCSSHPDNVAARSYEYAAEQTAKKAKEASEIAIKEAIYQMTPDSKSYEIVDIQRVGSHLVLKVLYPNCAKCSYEGNKVLVFLNVTEAQVLKWKIIDPHFRDPAKKVSDKEAPGPAARFPASKEGWCDAVTFAQGKDSKPTHVKNDNT